MLLSSNSPRQGCYYCLEFVPRGLSSAIISQRFREMKGGSSLAQHDERKSLSFRAFYFTVIPSEAEESRGNEHGGLFSYSP